MIRRDILCGMCVAVICSMAAASRGDEKSSTDAVRKAGGAVRTIAKNVKLKEVTLHLTDKEVTDAVLVHVAGIPDVAWLNLRGTKITDAGLANVGKMKTVTRLHLELTGIGDAGLVYLKGLANLEYLNLYGTQVTDAGLEHLKGLKNLEYLNLYGTQVTDAGLEHLQGLKKLKKLYLWQSKATPKGAEALAKAMPGLKVNIGAKLAAPAPAKPAAALPKKSLGKGQFVRVRLEGDNKILSLAEVEVLQTGDGTALHRAGKATQSSVAYEGAPQRAIDGNTNQAYDGNSVTHTATEKNPWWMVDLGGVKDIGRINILNRGDGVGERLEGAIVEVLDKDQKKVVYTTKITGAKTASKHAFEGK
jgi:hypothetical protein